jgi:hypothetical protein
LAQVFFVAHRSIISKKKYSLQFKKMDIQFGHPWIYKDIRMKIKSKKILVSMPESLLRKVDAASKRHSRTRSAEMCLRLGESLKTEKFSPVLNARAVE